MRRRVGGPLTALAMLVGLLAPPAGGEEAAAGRPDVQRVTLVTGDQVLVEVLSDGRYAASVRPRPGVTYEIAYRGDDAYVIPDDAAALIPDRLDRELFNVAELVRRGLDDEGSDDVPLVLEGRVDLPGLTTTATLESIGGEAVELDKDRAGGLGEAIADAAEPGDPDPLEAVEKIWLDAAFAPTLEQSTDQIGVPAARARGLDGTGVRVAILDTGVDASHPDLQGRVALARDFSGSGSTNDLFGHGTHVASIVGGTGAASEGSREGVAPAAELLSGKVLNDAGFGLSSWIIEGMEWSVAEGADVVNMSLGGAATDGTDPLSQAVDSLTASSGALFVVAAGNNGPTTRTVSSPGAASSALTVGAVSKSDTLASFSSRGPRIGDFAIKPDITAPGVGIAAARASDTSMGTPIDGSYTRASGTSMATPHVAGAAALLAQQRPGWDAGDLKAALVSSASPRTGLTVYEQGGGRVDLGRATAGPVVASPAPLDLGYFRWPHGDRDPVTRSVTLTNTGASAATLDLALEVTNEDGSAPAPGMLALSPASLTLEPGVSGVAEITLDPDVGALGLYGGFLVGRAGGEVRVRTPVGFLKEPERYEVVVRGIARDGAPAAGLSRAQLLNVDDMNAFLEERFFIAGEARFRVPPGTYDVFGSLRTDDETGRLNGLAWVQRPEIEITGDTEILLDARTAAPIRVSVSGTPTAAQQITLNRYRQPLEGGSMHNGHVIGFEVPVFASPTDPVTEGVFEFASMWHLHAPGPDGTWSRSSPYLFDLSFPYSPIPAELDETVEPATLARIDTGYASQVAPRDHEAVWRNGWRPWQFLALDLAIPARAPFERAEYLSPGDTAWKQTDCPRFFNVVEPFACFTEPASTYGAGSTRSRVWASQPMHAAPLFAHRDRFTLTLLVDPLVDGLGHASSFVGGLGETTTVYENGAQVAQESSGFVSVFAPDEERRYRVEHEIAPTSSSWMRLATRVRTAWEFDSGPERSAVPILDDTSGYEQVPPVMSIDYELPGLDLLGRAPFPSATNGPFPISFTVAHPEGAEPAAVTSATLAVSHDDGATWRPVSVTAEGEGRFRAQVDHDGGGLVSLRVAATDEHGSTVEQTITRAYAITPPVDIGVNAADGAHVDADGFAWSADRPYAPGGWGYTNLDAKALEVGHDITGTDDDVLYRFARQDPGAYRFDVPDGVYEVRLGFAELSNRSAGTRVFEVTAEGEVVLAAHDVAAHVGTRATDDHILLARVTDGTLDLDFRKLSGAPPIVNAIRVTQTAG